MIVIHTVQLVETQDNGFVRILDERTFTGPSSYTRAVSWADQEAAKPRPAWSVSIEIRIHCYHELSSSCVW